jgi:hypothetical protein
MQGRPVEAEKRSYIMTHCRGMSRFVSMSVALVLLAACAGQREPAQKMMNDIEAAAGAAATDAAKYVPNQLNDVQTKLDDLKTAFDAQDYQGVLARGPALLSEAQGLAGAAAAKKADTVRELNDEWSALAISVPDELTAIHSRLDMLGQSKNRKLAKGVDLEAANSGLNEATSQWSKAQGAFGNGNLDEAVAAGKDAKSKLETVAGTLKVDPPTAQVVPR